MPPVRLNEADADLQELQKEYGMFKEVRSTIRSYLFVAVLAGSFVLTADVADAQEAARAKTVRMPSLKAKVTVPGSWTRTKVERGKKVTFAMPNGGKFSVSYKAKKLPLKAVAKGIKAAGRKGGWKLIEERPNVKHFKKRAYLLVYQVPTKKPRVKVRVAFFLVNTPNGYYTLYFGTKRKFYRGGLYKAVYSTFRGR